MKAFGSMASPRTAAGSRVPASESLTPTSSQKHRPSRIPKENVDPLPASDPSSYRSPGTSTKPLSTKNRSPLPPRPPQPAAKKKLSLETLSAAAEHVGAPTSSDSGVQVIVRIRPPSKEEEGADQIVDKISQNSISIADHTFTFDSVSDAKSTQEDIFRLLGLPLVENCLSGFNSSIFAYGQTGSGKTYTMWGPPSALLDNASSSSDRGLTPRVFERLFSRIEEEEAKNTNKQLNYQCRCSFLEIYNEQITDLLDPNQRNLQIREDVRTGVYVDCLTEEFVSTMKDLTHLLMKGLANRRTGATSINAESSRSHCVLTCIVESRSKSMDDGLINRRTSRINLVDLAGSERQKQTGAAGERLKEAGNINRSLSQLGNLINILAEVSQNGKQRHIPYRDSKLTFLLQESLGGNAKMAMICGISPSQSCKSETLSTLRFAQRAKAIKNTAVINEITEDDVNVLREQIRQLKDELLRMKSNEPTATKGSFSTGWNARRSLSLLKMSLSRPTTLSAVKDDSDEEMEIDESDVEMPCIQATQLLASGECRLTSELTASKTNIRSSACRKTDVIQDLEPCTGNIHVSGVYEGDVKEIKTDLEKCNAEVHDTTNDDVNEHLGTSREAQKHKQEISQFSESHHLSETNEIVPEDNSQRSSSSSLVCSLNIVPCQTSPVLQQPTLDTSPVADTCIKRSLKTSAISASHNNILEDVKSGSGASDIILTGTSNPLHASLSKSCIKLLPSTDELEASLQRGLQIIDNRCHSLAVRRSTFRFSVAPDVKPMTPVTMVNSSMQTDQDSESRDLSAYICCSCKKKSEDESEDVSGNTDLQLVPVEEPISSNKPKMQVPKAVEKVLAGSIRREMALEDQCAKQHNEIKMLNRLIEQYKHERECNAIIAQTREDKISRLENLMDGILPSEDFMEEEFISLANEHKILKEKYDSHPKILQANIEIKRIQRELDSYKNFFDMGERDVLIEEIQDLRTQLQFYIDSSKSSQKFGPLLHLTHSAGTSSTPLNTMPEMIEGSGSEEVCPERCSWTERESYLIALSEELRLKLDSSQCLAEKLKVELDSEKKCTEELKEALQMAMQGHVRILEQYSELQEKHTALRAMNRRISEGVEDIKKAAAKAGVRGAESRFINALAAELSVTRAERERERKYWMDESRGLQAQLRDTAEAVQAAGELLVRLKDTEEAAAAAERRALLAEQETEKAYKEIDHLKKIYDREIALLHQSLSEPQIAEEPFRDVNSNISNDGEYPINQRWIENEFEPFCMKGDTEFSKDTDPNSWFSGYDRCNI